MYIYTIIMRSFGSFINRLTITNLKKIKGIGDILATRIIFSRDLNNIKSIDDFKSIYGINVVKTINIHNEYKNYILIKELKERKNSINYK